MTKRVELDPAALEEIREAARRMESQVEGLGTEFVAAVRKTLARVAVAPEAFSLVRGATGKRSAPVKRFRYRVFFLELPDLVRVLAVARDKRRPGYWRERG